MRSDLDLLEDWRAGDEAAGNTLFQRHFASMARFFRNKVGERYDDLVQKTFLTALETRDRFRADASFRTYLFGIANNQLRNEVRKLGRERARFDPETQSVVDLGLSPASVIERKRERRLVLEALRRVPITTQVVLELFYWEQMSGAEIAAVLETTEGTIRSRIKRGREQLAQVLQTLARTPEELHSTLTRLDDWAAELRDQVAPQVSAG